MTEEQGGRALGSRYRLVERLGQGASGEVWRAWDRQAERAVAAKLLWPRHAADPEILSRFVHERAVLLGLDHPQIVRVHDFVVEGEDLAIVMDLVEGPSLATLVEERGTLAPATAVPLAAAVLDALASAHARGVTHRDVKPDNVLLVDAGDPGPEGVRLADFGIAGIVQDEVAAVTELIGTPGYMAPELVSYGRSGPASDVYAVGVLLYELLAGRTPFAGPGTNVTVALRHVTSEPPRLPVADALGQAIRTMLAKDPARRGTARECAAALRALPADALGAVALPAQEVPDAWATATDGLPDKATVERSLAGGGRGEPRAPATLDDADAGATSMRALRPSASRAVTPIEPVAVLAAGALDGSGEPSEHGEHGAHAAHGATMAKAAPRVDARPVPSTRSAQPGWSTRTRVLVAAATAVVLAGGGAAVWRSGLLDRDAADADAVEITTAAAHLGGRDRPTGLRMDLDAAYDAAAGRTDLTVTLSGAPNAPLLGDVLLVVPGAQDGQACGEVAEQEGVVVPVRASTDGLDIPCGHRLPAVAVQPGAPVTVVLPVDLDLVDDEGQVAEGYGPWLSAMQQATDQALSAITGTAYPLQRVSGIVVEPTGVTLAGPATPVPYRVAARWSGGGPEEGTDLFTDGTTDGMEVELLLALTGGQGLDGADVRACGAAQVIGIRVLAEQPERSCAIEVGLGALESPAASFAIQMR